MGKPIHHKKRHRTYILTVRSATVVPQREAMLRISVGLPTNALNETCSPLMDFAVNSDMDMVIELSDLLAKWKALAIAIQINSSLMV